MASSSSVYRHRNLQNRTATTSSSNHGRRAATSTSISARKTGPIRPKIRQTTLSSYQRARLKRPDILPHPRPKQPPPSDAEVVEISSGDDRPTKISTVPAPQRHPRASGSGARPSRSIQAALQETIDLTMDDDGDEEVSTAFVSAPVVSSGRTRLNFSHCIVPRLPVLPNLLLLLLIHPQPHHHLPQLR